MSGLVTTTLAVPTAPLGVVQVRLVDDTKDTLVQADPPIETVAPDTNPVPVTVTAVPPVSSPELGAMDVNVGVDTGTV